jgi:hypothetical protein
VQVPVSSCRLRRGAMENDSEVEEGGHCHRGRRAWFILRASMLACHAHAAGFVHTSPRPGVDESGREDERRKKSKGKRARARTTGVLVALRDCSRCPSSWPFFTPPAPGF